ncbi:MAG: YcgN family cysteine cluster protein [Desulfobacteraceae bacterium]|nr:YcgN family cysteine cluster protein [Desulfobacteraceae bacterium]
MNSFWENKTLAQLTKEQWEALCDGCGRCCLQKLKNPTTGKIYYTWVACHLLDIESCRCSGYELRHILVPDCLELFPGNILRLRWLPKTCAYRLIAEQKPLPEWHPLISGDIETVHAAGISVRGRAISELHVRPDDIEKYPMK